MKKRKKSLTPSERFNKYASGIPKELHALLLPQSTRGKLNLLKAVKQLRITEKERNYVTEIQQHFSLPLRPNESLKRTMIRVRLKVLKSKLAQNKISGSTGNNSSLPTDPLE